MPKAAAKNLKAVAIEADRREDIANPAEFRKLVQEQLSNYKSKLGFKEFREHGTVIGVDLFHSLGTYPVRNYRFGELEGWEKLPYKRYSRITEKHLGCYSCMLKCGKLHKVSSGSYAGVTSLGPQYETVWAFSGPTGCTDLGATVLANHLCCELGLDAVSTGNVVGFAYELFEKGILTAKDTGGLGLNYGDHKAMIELVEQIGHREGLGDILAEGVKRASSRIGKGAEAYAMHVKGLEMPGYDPRARKTEGMNYALANIGANHCYGYAGQEIGNPRPWLVDPVALPQLHISSPAQFRHAAGSIKPLRTLCLFT